MKRLLILTLAICACGLAGCGDDNEPTGPKTVTQRVAYLHRPIAGYDHAEECKTYLDAVGFPTSLVSIDTVTDVVWTSFDVIVIDDRAGTDIFTFGTANQVAAVRDAGLPILATGLGGYTYLDAVDTSTTLFAMATTYIDSTSALDNTRYMVIKAPAVDTADVIFRSPVDIFQPADTALFIQPRGYTTGAQLSSEPPDSVVLLGRFSTSANLFTTMRFGNRTIFFGYGGSMNLMTTSGRFLFTNILYDLTH